MLSGIMWAGQNGLHAPTAQFAAHGGTATSAKLRGLHHRRRCLETAALGDVLAWLGRRQQAFALSLFAGQFAKTAHGLGLLPNPSFRRFLVGFAEPHFAEEAFSLQFLFQHA